LSKAINKHTTQTTNKYDHTIIRTIRQVLW